MAWMTTTDLCRYYERGRHEVRAVDHVDLQIERGEFVVIIGASGSGKSTLLNLLAGLDRPTAGHIEVGGERRGKAREILERLGLGDRMDHRPGDLSGGEQQRVALARALVKRPQIIFADEPTGNLDEENSRSIVDLLMELNGEGLTVLVVTHDADMAHRAANRILRMHYGRVVGDSSTAGGGGNQ